VNSPSIELEVQLGRLRLRNPVTVASGTFGYAREMQGLVDFSRLGGILPKTVTKAPRPGNPPPRTCETTAGMLNSIGLDNDGIDAFLDEKMPYLAGLDTATIVSVAGKSEAEFVELAGRLDGNESVAAVELNISCPNVSGGVDFGTDPTLCEKVVAGCRRACDRPVIAKLTPNVTDVTTIARAAEAGVAVAVSLMDTCLGRAVDWRRRRAGRGNVMGGLSGPAIKPIALRMVFQVARAVSIPVMGIGGIATVDDVMEFLLAGATAVQVGTVNFYHPRASVEIVDALPAALAELGATRVSDIVGKVEMP